MKFGSKKYASEEDRRAQKVLSSPDIMEAQKWLERYPKAPFSSHALDPRNPNGTPLAPVVACLVDAGAQRLAVHHANGKIFLGLVVVLPADKQARQRLLAIDPELSQLCVQRAQEDYGQKYLYYSLQ